MGCEAGSDFCGAYQRDIRECFARHVEEAFAVRMGEGPWQELLWKTAVMDIAFTFMPNPGMTVTRVFQRRIPNTGPYASAPILVDFSGFVCKVKHPSEAVKV